MSQPAVYLDECVDQGLAATLRQRGFMVVTATETGFVGSTDAEQLRYATSQDWTILSHNRGHFRRLHTHFTQQGLAHGGIIILPQTSLLPQLTIRAAMMLDWLLILGEHRSRIFQWGDLQQQLTSGLRPIGYTEDEIRLALGHESRA